MALISDLPNATPQKSDLMEIQNGQTSSNNSSVGQLMQLSASENLAPAYDANAGVYAVGDFVSYNGTLYQCNTAIATPEAFDATKWTAKKVVDMTGSDIPVASGETETIAEAIGKLSEASTTTRPCLVTFTGAGQSLTCYVQIVGKVCIVNIFGNVNMGSVAGGTNLFKNLPPIDGLSQLYQLTDVGRFRLWKSGNDVKIGIYEPTSSTNYVGLSFIYKTT